MKYLYEKDNIIYAKCMNCNRVLKFKKFEVDEIATGIECFCGQVSNRIEGIPEVKNSAQIMPEKTRTPITPIVQTTPTRAQQIQRTGPACPTCGSRNITKISLTSKAVGGAMFGIFSSNIRNTFKCNSCGYKW